jgi:hypothetical protein
MGPAAAEQDALFGSLALRISSIDRSHFPTPFSNMADATNPTSKAPRKPCTVHGECAGFGVMRECFHTLQSVKHFRALRQALRRRLDSRYLVHPAKAGC